MSLDFILDRLTSVQVGGFWALVQVIIYALVIYLGLVIISKITDKRKREMKYIDGTPMSQDDQKSLMWLEAWLNICHEREKERVRDEARGV